MKRRAILAAKTVILYALAALLFPVALIIEMRGAVFIAYLDTIGRVHEDAKSAWRRKP